MGHPRLRVLLRDLLAVGGGACGQLAQRGKEASGGFRIIERIERDRGGELRRLRAEANLQHVLLAHGHQSIEFGSGILLPVSAGGENDGAGFVDVPFAFIAAEGGHAAAVGAPAMAHHFEMKAGRAAQIGLEGKVSFCLCQQLSSQWTGKARGRNFMVTLAFSKLREGN